ncbi:MAG TPA: hypothetical protein VIQ30_20095, partial [Pseudonocardia sp.]
MTRPILVDPADPVAMRRTLARYRRFRPWLWTVLGGRRLWLPEFRPFSNRLYRLAKYRWKTAADRHINQRTSACCCHP